MHRIVTFAAALAFASPAAAQVTASLATPTLKGQVTIASDVVRIGDLVENAGAASHIAVFRSPDPGHTGAVPVARVLDAVRAHDVQNVDTGGLSEVVVTHASRPISARDFEQRIIREFSGHHGLGEETNLSLTFDREPRTIHVPLSASDDLRVMRMGYDRRTSRFDITFGVPGRVVPEPLRLTGTLHETVELVLPTRPLAKGDVIKLSDLVVERRPKNELRGDVIRNADLAVGLAARRPLRAGELMRAVDLGKPDLVQRNDMVMMVYEAPGVVITIRGKALDSGAQGDVVNALNVESKRTIQGIVTGPGRITIAGTTRHAMSADHPQRRITE
jgi:flagella basal body P-ring formation protein FlgA